MKTDQEYLAAIVESLRQNADARAFYFPAHPARRKEGSLRLGREFGYGLRSEAIFPTIYSQLIVQFCLDSTGVQIDNEALVGALRAGMAQARAYEEEGSTACLSHL